MRVNRIVRDNRRAISAALKKAPRCAIEWRNVLIRKAIHVALTQGALTATPCDPYWKHNAQRCGTSLANLSVDESASMTSRLSYSSTSIYLR
jgi:hypothetical protein